MDDTITGMILQGADELVDQAYEETGWFSYVKAFFGGLLLGLVDGCFIAGAVVTVIGFIGLIFGKKENY